jgi:MOSC domain-containing protein YiiM
MRAEVVGIQYSPVPESFDRSKKPRGGFPMIQLDSAELVAGRGIRSLEGVEDRYFGEVGQELNGAYPNNKVRQLSIITWDAVERANNKCDIPFTWAETRRNVVVSNLSAEDLNNLLGKKFSINGVELEGVELCDPCDRPDKLSGKKGFKLGFTNQNGVSIGGLRVKILNSGLIKAEL